MQIKLVATIKISLLPIYAETSQIGFDMTIESTLQMF